MLSEERYAAIERAVNEKGALTIGELTELLGISESTIRRDLTTLHRQGRVNKVHGGATAGGPRIERDMADKYQMYTDEKKKIASFAASLIQPRQMVYLDAGTTTEFMAGFISQKTAVYVTNGIGLAQKLAAGGFHVYITPGRIKATTEAVIGDDSGEYLQKFNFDLGFFGTNGVDIKNGYTTPDIAEARAKTQAFNRCHTRYILADPSKFGAITAVTFAPVDRARIITTTLADPVLRQHTDVLEAVQR